MTVSATGNVRFVGKLGDAAPVSVSATMDKLGNWPFVFSIPAKATPVTELVLGMLTANTASPAGFTGNLDWFTFTPRASARNAKKNASAKRAAAAAVKKALAVRRNG